MAQEVNHSGIKALHTTLDIIQFLRIQNRSTLEDIAAGVGVSTSTVHRHLVTLRDRGYIITEDRGHRLSLRFLTDGGQVRTQFPNHEIIGRKVQQVSEETGERAQFIVEEYGERVYIYTRAGPNAVKTDATIGKRGPLHVSAAGKAILANLREDRLAEIIANRGLEPATKQSITDRETLASELNQVREQGFALNDEESTDGLRAVGVPVRCDEQVLGAMSISAPANRLNGEYYHKELPNFLLGTVNEIELNLKYS